VNILQFIFETVAKNQDFFSFEGEFSQSRYKRFAELAIFMHYASHDNDSNRCTQIKSALVSKIEKVFPDDIFRNFYTSYHMIMPYAYIRPFYKSDKCETALNIICTEEFFSPEIPPHRRMEWDLMLFKLGRKDALAVDERSILCRNFYLPFVDRDLVYALTHAVFYATDFGFHTEKPAGIDIDRLLFRIGCLTARFCAAKDVDVSLELAISFAALYPFAGDRAQADAMFNDIIIMCEQLVHDTDFLNLEYEHILGTEGILEEKYHTLFVLGIFQSLLHSLQSRNLLTIDISGSLFASDDIFARVAQEHAPLALEAAWNIVRSLEGKAYATQSYQDYKDAWGRLPFLEDEINFILKIMHIRNQNQILWNSEFELLGVPPERQQELVDESHADLLEKMAHVVEGNQIHHSSPLGALQKTVEAFDDPFTPALDAKSWNAMQ
jgi:hypothetical protein